jgi:para-nitrobenzyl esterase
MIVQTGAGPVQGASMDGVARWLGIPYAQPPVGDLRWRAPHPPEAWTDVRPATAFGAAAPQPANEIIRFTDGVTQSEDCLTLNVWVADGVEPDAALPVLFWIHGGAYMFGGSAQTGFDGRALVASGEVVLVTVNYRLGALGFLDLGAWDSPEHPFDTNLALRDVLLALQWVQRNVAGFGGDPQQVVIWGESAGGGLVTTLLAVPAATGLFHRAIAHSSPATSVYSVERTSAIARQFLDAVGVSEDAVATLRELPVARLVETGSRVYAEVPETSPGVLAFTPSVDGDLLPEHPVAVLRDGRGIPVPLLIGTNHDEASLFKFMKSPLMPIESATIMQMFGAIAHERPDVELPSRAQVASAYSGIPAKRTGLSVAGDIGFRMPTLWLVEGHARVAPVHLYRFDWATPMLHLIGMGAAHATELPYAFGNLDGGPKDITFKLGGRHRGEAISQRMRARWIAFAVRGVPDGGAEPAWPPFDTSVRATLVIDATDRVVDDLDGELRRAWGEQVLSFE